MSLYLLFVILSLYLKIYPNKQNLLKVINRYSRTHFLNTFYTFFKYFYSSPWTCKCWWVTLLKSNLYRASKFRLPVYLFTFTSIAYSYHFYSEEQAIIKMKNPERFVWNSLYNNCYRQSYSTWQRHWLCIVYL